MHPDKLLVLDFGSQYTQLIARRVRELGVYCELHPHDVGDAFISEYAPRGIKPLPLLPPRRLRSVLIM